MRNLVPGREQFESGVPGRAREGKLGHVLEQHTTLAIQGNSSWKKLPWASQYTREKAHA